jgi:uncharacterized protein YlzI (FlbEa/FlbD family)
MARSPYPVIVDFTQLDGSVVSINTEQIADVKEFPAGQCWVTMVSGNFYQLQDDVEKVRQVWKESQK